tara:strand:+ start:228 stop:791 length:564 start_codon:yes stop_codon:yes gene_type:complete
MVSVKGQLDAPLVDMGAVKQDFWERKTIVLPSLARLTKSKGWRSWFTKKQSPKIVVRRLKSSQWEEIQTNFAAERTELAKSGKKLREITEKINNFKPLTSDEKKLMLHANQLAQPMVYSMISKMTEEPKMVYEDVVILMETLDDYDRQTLIGLVNAMSSNKATALHALHQERSAELSKIKSEMGINA